MSRSSVVGPVPEAPFRKPFKQLNRCDRKRLRLRSPLEHALRTAGIVPIEEASVENYKAGKLDKLHNPPPKVIEIRKPNRKLLYAGLIIMTLGLCSVVFGTNALLTQVLLVSGFTLFVPGAVGLKRKETVSGHAHKDAEWRINSLTLYMAPQMTPIPSEVNDVAREIEMRCPGTALEVHYLYEDPFLRAVFRYPETGNVERFYVAFWDENGFRM